jgi:hypothetical protein
MRPFFGGKAVAAWGWIAPKATRLGGRCHNVSQTAAYFGASEMMVRFRSNMTRIRLAEHI